MQILSHQRLLQSRNMPDKKKPKKSPTKKLDPPIYCVWGLLCSDSSLDKAKNNLTLFNVIDQFQVDKRAFVKSQEMEQPVGVNAQHEIVTLWRRKIDARIDNRELTFNISLSLVDPSGKTVANVISDSPLVMKSSIRVHRFRMKFDALLVTQPGDYTYKIWFKAPDEEQFTLGKEVPFIVSEL